MKENIDLQPIRVPTGWAISINNFFNIDPVDEYIDYFYSSVLISGDSKLMGLSFDSRYEPEGVPNGDFILVMQKNEYNKKGMVINADVIDIIKTKERHIFTKCLEYFMMEGGKLPFN